MTDDDEDSAETAPATASGVRRPRVDKTARKAEYLRAAARAFLAKGASASMQDVADAAGAPKPVFYRIFPSRSELIQAFYGHVEAAILKVQQGTWDGYGWALRMLYAEARREPEIFLVALKIFRGDPELEVHRARLLLLIERHAEGFFQPAAGAPAGAANRTELASRTMSYFVFDTLVSWLEDADGLTDEKRFVWYGRIIREWRKAMREAYELDPPAAPRPSSPSADG